MRDGTIIFITTPAARENTRRLFIENIRVAAMSDMRQHTDVAVFAMPLF